MQKVYFFKKILIACITIVLFAFFPFTTQADEPKVKKPMIAFTFDDGPNTVYTEKLLDGLAKRNAHATFFVVGEKLDENSTKYKPEAIEKCKALVARMVRDGHVVANHSYSHCWLNKETKEKVKYELNKTSMLIEDITNQKVKYMRPPGGSTLTAPWVREIASPMITVCWGYYDVRDWECRNVDKMVNVIVENTFDGDIVLLHDNYETSIETALSAIDILMKKGYSIVTVDELLNRNTGNGWVLDSSRIYCTMKEGDYSRLKRETVKNAS